MVNAALDSLTSCAFSSDAFTVGDYAEALTLVTGESFTAEVLMTAGGPHLCPRAPIQCRERVTERDDTRPARFTHEGVPDGIHAGTVCNLEPMLDEYYALRG